VLLRLDFEHPMDGEKVFINNNLTAIGNASKLDGWTGLR